MTYKFALRRLASNINKAGTSGDLRFKLGTIAAYTAGELTASVTVDSDTIDAPFIGGTPVVGQMVGVLLVKSSPVIIGSSSTGGGTGGHGSVNVVTGTQGDATGTSIASTVAGTGPADAGAVHDIAIGQGANTAAGSSGNSIAIGDSAQTLNTEDVAIGVGAIAGTDASVGSGAIAVGSSPRALGDNSVAVGLSAQALDTDAVAIGRGAGAYFPSTVAISNATANDPGGVAIGSAAVALVAAGTAVGYGAQAIGSSAVSIGDSSDAEGDQSTAIGNSKAEGNRSVAIGNDGSGLSGVFSRTYAHGDYDVALGGGAVADSRGNSGEPNLAAGALADAGGSGASTAVGPRAKALSHNTTAIGYGATAGDVSVAGPYATAVGYGTNAEHAGSVVIGADSSGSFLSSAAANDFVLGTPDHNYRANGTFHLMRKLIRTVTATYSVALTDCTILGNGTFTITLPAAGGQIAGRVFTIKNIGTGVITIGTTSTQLIDAATTKTLPAQYDKVTVQSDGTKWHIVG